MQQLRQAGELTAALQACQQLHSAHPNCLDVTFALGTVHLDMERFDEARGLIKQAVDQAPERGGFWLGFALCLQAMDQSEAARAAATKAVERLPENLVALDLLGTTCRECDDADASLQVFERVLSLSPSDAKAMYGKARTLLVLGRIEEAEAWFLKALEQAPDYFNCYQFLIQIKSDKLDVDSLKEIVEKYLSGASPDEKNVSTAYYALGGIEDRAKNFDKAFEYYILANESRSRRRPFDKDQFRRDIDDLIASFTEDVVASLSDAGCESRKPVFVVGLPRSGTTLTEQILSSHSKVYGAGELRRISVIVTAMKALEVPGVAYPRDVERIVRSTLRKHGEQYLQIAGKRAPEGAERIVDKMPGNILHVGLIGTMFPNATLIHCMRDPMDTAVSCFMQNFKETLSFTTDLGALGLYYRETLRLMEHWKAIFPGRILEVQYEDTIADPETMSRKLIAHAGLEWENQCLDFHKTERTVRTASQWQVRQPIYKTSVEKWRRYEKHLGPLIAALNGEEPEAAA
ncbi:tetratricopeptide repeat-containing sulfotransferase family protein [Rhodobium orientis]|uniref:tetratricopeptide repeat-containing sulfotransferase family protein n=1 Tax=Rhodobium orientis TaxID=34017 RepID=UPI0023EA73A3|nr:sulfotransferase [Rhodobium orientis]